jgi:hypothetical protein
MTPNDVAVVDGSWAQLRLRRDDLIDRLAVAFSAVRPPATALRRACWLVDSVAELVDLLTAPSQLGRRARQLFTTWPDPGSSPSFRIDGQAWISAARDVSPIWTLGAEHAWRHAWLLLSDVLSEEALSPFARSSPDDVLT